jgi:hypothetical protein
MRRRECITLAGGAALTLCLSARAERAAMRRGMKEDLAVKARAQLQKGGQGGSFGHSCGK